MNEGVIYKVKLNENNKKTYYIKLERTVKIGEIEYNIFIDSNQPMAELIPVDTPFKFSSDLTSLIDKKLEFEINKETKKIISIVYET